MDSKLCIQAFEKLWHGQFSSIPQVSSFLSTVSHYQVSLLHLAGSANFPSDFASGNAPPCDDPRCQICLFASEAEELAVRLISVHDMLSGKTSLPFTNPSAWLRAQLECPDLRHALHLKLGHPTRHQMKLVSQHYFFALDLDNALDRFSQCCHLCSSLKKVPSSLVEQSTSDPPEALGISFATDVIKRCRQLVVIVCEASTSFTASCLLNDERRESLHSGLPSK